MKTNQTLVVVTIVLLLLSACCLQAEEKSSVPVGMTGRIEEVILPGTELEVKPIDDNTSVVVRIVETYPHGTDVRYELEYYGLKPGDYNLIDFLQRKDESDISKLPAINITIRSILPADRIEPNLVQTESINRLGGYKYWVAIGGVLWFLGLFGILFLKKRREASQLEVGAKPLTLADRIRPLVNSAIKQEATSGELANLEMTLVALWRKRLSMNDLPASEAVIALRQHEQAGPLLIQLERWLHSPHQEEPVDVEAMLEPYKELPHDSFEEFGNEQ